MRSDTIKAAHFHLPQTRLQSRGCPLVILSQTAGASLGTNTVAALNWDEITQDDVGVDFVVGQSKLYIPSGWNKIRMETFFCTSLASPSNTPLVGTRVLKNGVTPMSIACNQVGGWGQYMDLCGRWESVAPGDYLEMQAYAGNAGLNTYSGEFYPNWRIEFDWGR